jgi:heat shock protein HslJ
MFVPTLRSMQAPNMAKVSPRRLHPHAMAALLAFVALGCLVSGPVVYRVITDKNTEGRWVLEQAPSPITPGLMMTIEGKEIRGEGPCNGFRSGWSQSDGPVGEMSTTLVGCPTPDSAEQEDAYFTVLTDVGTVEVDDDRLTLSGPRGRLIYGRAD